MTDTELKQWLAVTANSQYQWTEDEITRQNGRGELYYFGGEDGVYIRVQPDGELSLGTYEGAFPSGFVNVHKRTPFRVCLSAQVNTF